ncbi:hypothetical protein ACJMK2_042912 [Sinanodonta woodiana]|uniref:Uncharacterized protein n=1 Tax=Sinanodonta woodiana TaxID=1069815 RepID=A0ABD3VVA5_SINWO
MTVLALSIMLCVLALSDSNDCSLGVTRCMWEPWNPWGSCSESCGTGIASRSRGLCCKEGQDINACVKECGVKDSAYDLKPCNVPCDGVSQTNKQTGYTVSVEQPTSEAKSVPSAITSAATSSIFSLSNATTNPAVSMSSMLTSNTGTISTTTSSSTLTSNTETVSSATSSSILTYNTETISSATSSGTLTSNTETISNATSSSILTFNGTAASAATSSSTLTFSGTAASASMSSLVSNYNATIAAGSATTEQPSYTVLTRTKESPTTSASCVAKIADVVFVIDSSGSIGAENFLKLKEFMKNIVRTFDIDSRYTRVAVIKYNDYPNIEFKLNNHTNLNDLLAAIDGINYTIGGTNTADAIQLMRSEGFDRERPAAPDIGIVITDGLSKYPTLTKAQADLAKNEGITLFAIGIGNETQQEELKNIASGDRVYQVEGFDALETINLAVAHTTCGVNLNESFVTRSTTSPRTTPSGCADYDDNCGSYGRDSCYDYEPFARGHCPKSCGFCRDANATITNVCADAINDCAQYGVEMCYKESQHDWVEANCQKFCGFCGEKNAPLPTTPVSTIATTTAAQCIDSVPNCHEYGGPGMCQTYGQWARQNCAKYCGVCFNYVHVTASTVGNKKCPAWKIPEACTLEHIPGQCCLSPKCPDGFILTVHRH